MTEERDK